MQYKFNSLTNRKHNGKSSVFFVVVVVIWRRILHTALYFPYTAEAYWIGITNPFAKNETAAVKSMNMI